MFWLFCFVLDNTKQLHNLTEDTDTERRRRYGRFEHGDLGDGPEEAEGDAGQVRPGTEREQGH